MIRSYRVRQLVGHTTGIMRAGTLLVVGLLIFTFGAGLSFKSILAPALSQAARISREVVVLFVPRAMVEVGVHSVGGAFLFLGGICIYIGARRVSRRIVDTWMPDMKRGRPDVYWRRQMLAQGPRIVAMGGGTGLSTLLRGLKAHSSNITAIVTVTDDGGSSGRLVQDKGMIPPGDIRNCLVALADAEKSMTDLFQHRFQKDSGSLSGHSVGNLLIAALVDQARGDFDKAIEIASDVLNIRGRVLPSTLEHVRLRAEMEDGSEICGETAIVQAHKPIARIYLDPGSCSAHRAAVEAIRAADLICIGPGSVFTSVIPNLLVPDIAAALSQTDAPKVYLCNVMTQPGESDSFSASQHVAAITRNVPLRVFDYVVVNTGVPSEAAIERYRESGQMLVDADTDNLRSMGYRVLSGDYMSETDVVRHDPAKVAQRVLGLLGR